MSSVSRFSDETLGSALRHKVTAAVLTPFDADGTPNPEAVGPYAASLVRDGVGALAVGAHTGRGALLTDAARMAVVRSVRDAVDAPLVAGVGPANTERMAEQMAESGADALLLYPSADPDVVGLHARVARASGLPVIAFVLYEAASGAQYPADLTRRLVATEGVLGVKVAVLDDAVACQDVLTTCRAERPETILFTGEDRMFGPSLLWGADAALVGLAAAVPGPTVATLAAWIEHRYADFVRASAVVDAVAAEAFRAPVDRYVQRMAWLAEWEGRLPADLCHDPIADPAMLPEKDAFLTRIARLLPVTAAP
ncbi:dihydrodipicolinate synthase family protein [Labedaea rhizosphaerae]|uniref:4-hydroxy-tetrahydrodipicolinate synthase n=1 Tax=Labedaea rhizosphaerae TaxID=598644 RepID=A0A4R6S803_LABRH|nr:dihydrodipicolinate synthase family protein [Labedaea rhizosphaerae]TDP94955.1 4-hydroxy-tetrahydrodipicolinate synthase [Labedaea rhizosphaerae]